jgi:hypothetical protein
VPELKLPLELILGIAHHLFHDISHGTGHESSQAALAALSQTCQRMYAELFQLVYYRVLLATEAQASWFVRTVESDEWQDKLLTGGAENLVRSVCLGGSEDEGEGRVSEYLAQSRLVRRVLNGLDKPSLRQVKLTNVQISLQALTGLSGKSRPSSGTNRIKAQPILGGCRLA